MRLTATRPVLVAAILAALALCVPAGTQAALPDGRGYELVNTNDVGNDFPSGTVAVSDDGLRVTYAERTTAPSFMTATRAPDGWRPVSMNPPADELLEASYSIGVFALTPDRTQVFAGAFAGLSGEPLASTLVRLDASGHQSVFATLPVTEAARGTLDMVVSDDGTHAFSNLQTSFDPEHVPDTIDVYDVAQDPPVLVSRLPDGSVPACGTNSGFASQAKGSTMVQHWVSRDGTKVFFLSRGSVDCSSPFVLYRRDMSSGMTVQISGSDASAAFLQASADGEAVVYETAEGVVPADTNGHPDVYEWTAAGGNECLTCVVADANVLPWGTNFEKGFGVSEDLSHVYFASSNVLAPADTDGTTSLYVWHTVNGVRRIDYISPLLVITGAATELVNSPTQGVGSTMTPDGNAFIFTSNVPGLDAITGRSNGGTLQYYRYGDTTGGLSCVSCPASGPPTAGSVPSLAVTTAGLEGYARVLSDDGHIFVFRTLEALVPQDVDNGPDLYEWHDGQVSLISDGVSTPTGTRNRASSLLRGISASGNDVIFSSYSVLTPDASPGSQHIYDARAGGGFQFPAGAPPCDGEDCQGPSAPPPAFADPVTLSFAGPGDATSQAAKPAVKPARAQKLARALQACRKRKRGVRKKCESQARKRYATKASKQVSKSRGSN